MKKINFLISLIVIMLVSCSDDEPSFVGDTKDYEVVSMDDSGISGTITFSSTKNGSTNVKISLSGTENGVTYAAGLFTGADNDAGDLFISLNPVDGGTGISTTQVSHINAGEAVSFQQMLTLNGHLKVFVNSLDNDMVAVSYVGRNDNIVPDQPIAIKFPLGIHRPNLVWEDNLNQAKYLLDKIVEMGADVVRMNPQQNRESTFIEHVLHANQLGLKVHMSTPTTGFAQFYPEGTTKRPEVSGWGPRYRLSDISPDNVKQWMAGFFDQVKAAGAVLQSVELGNELNWIDFNGDLEYVPGGKFYDYSTNWDDEDYARIRLGFEKYGQCLKYAREELDRVWGTNAVKLITHGAVRGTHLSDWTISRGGSIVSTKMMLDLLKGTHPNQVNAPDYLQYVDGVGIHLYPETIEFDVTMAKDKLGNEIKGAIDPIHEVVSNDMPVWVTEWGYTSSKFNNNQDERYIMLSNFVAACNELPYNWGDFFLYTFDEGSHSIFTKGDTEQTGDYLPAAQIFKDYEYSHTAN